ncbi:MAG: hypothetical protein M1546_19355 [Chloroflexi bacterium]|nr:hypothetical protein [Chloroflexota bacterium]
MRLFGLFLIGVFCTLAAGTIAWAGTVPGAEKPIYAAYFYDEGCQACSGAEFNVDYLRSRYPQLVVQQFNTSQDETLGRWLARRAGRSAFQTPAFFIADQAWMGEIELTPAAIQAALERYTAMGTQKIWEGAGPIRWRGGLNRDSPVLGRVLAILFGLLDGLLPAAMSVLLFLEVVVIVYGPVGQLTGRSVQPESHVEDRAPGMQSIVAFVVGMFLTLSALGLAGYANPIRLEAWLGALHQPAMVTTILACLALALFALVRWVGARRAQHPLPTPARLVSHGPPAGWLPFIAGAAGVLVTIPALASVGQGYLPAVIYICSIFTAPVQALLALLLYNVLFVLPLAVMLVLAIS